MHELSIAMSLLDVVEAEAARRGDARVTAVHLKWGPLSGVMKDALVSAYELAREGTALAGCALVIQEMPVVAYCKTCEANRSVVSVQHLCCDVCGLPTPEIVSGRELEVSAMEICE